jgi:hypothetical protein
VRQPRKAAAGWTISSSRCSTALSKVSYDRLPAGLHVPPSHTQRALLAPCTEGTSCPCAFFS